MGLSYSENSGDFPKFRFPFDKMVGKQLYTNHCPQAKHRFNMKIQSFNIDLEYDDIRPLTKVILETSFSKEIRILFKKGQIMKEHKAPFPIIVHILEGEIDFGIQGISSPLKAGFIVTLEGNVLHDLTAREDSIVRLTLLKVDNLCRLDKIAKN